MTWDHTMAEHKDLPAEIAVELTDELKAELVGTTITDVITDEVTPQLQLTDEQQAAVEAGVAAYERAVATGESQFISVQGAAGTGKTTATKAILAGLEEAGASIGLAAPTHKAAGVLQKACGGAEAITVASLLGLREQISEHSVDFVPIGEPRIGDAQVWVIDEASMIHPQHLAILQGAARWEDNNGGVPRLFIFIGDPAQLPPVKHNGVSPALQLEGSTNQLSVVHRHAGPVLELATAIRAGGARPRLTGTQEGDSSIICHDTREDFFQTFLATVDEDQPDRARILAFTNKACAAYNDAARRHFLGAEADPFVEGELLITHGGAYDPWAVQSNPFKADLAYGTSRELRLLSAHRKAVEFTGIGKCGNKVMRDGYEQMVPRVYQFNAWELKTANGFLWAIDPSHKDYLQQGLNWLKDHKYWWDFWLVKRSFADLQPHWAITTHKSQGSQFENVFVDVADIDKCKEEATRRSLLYTAVTRATKALHVVADHDVHREVKTVWG